MPALRMQRPFWKSARLLLVIVYVQICDAIVHCKSPKNKGVADFCKAIAKPIAQADLMLVVLELGNVFEVEYGDVDAGFYNALLTMASRAAETICFLSKNCSSPSLIDSLRSCSLRPASAGANTTSLLRSMSPL